VSDQDFFFDEEEESAKPAPQTESKGSAKTVGKSPAPRPRQTASPSASGGSFFEQNVSMAVAGLMTVIGLLIGVILGYVVAPDAVATNTGITGTGTGTAPSLTQDQLNSGSLPAGHPDISGVAPTESVTPTSN
jgi:hypothetical protein